jgi:hypothetical protein
VSDSADNNWPIVDVNDDGIRPAGPQDACIYCGQKIGMRHGTECVMVKKTVKLRYTYDIEVEVPHFWDSQDIEFHRNESTWCANNSLSELEETQKRDGCLCHVFDCAFLGVVDDNPRAKLRDPSQAKDAASKTDKNSEPS